MQSLRRLLGFMDTGADSEYPQAETYNPWTVVNLVFRHLADEGLHPILGESGDPGRPAAELLRALGLAPAYESRPHVLTRVSDELARLRAAFEAEHPSPGRQPSQVESTARLNSGSDPAHKDFPTKGGCR